MDLLRYKIPSQRPSQLQTPQWDVHSDFVIRLIFIPLLQGTAAEISVWLHLLANGIVWMAPQAVQTGVRKQLMAALASLPATYLPGSTAEQPVSFFHPLCRVVPAAAV